MNRHFYRTRFDRRRGTCVAVAEILPARGKGAGVGAGARAASRAMVLAVTGALWALPALAGPPLPTGGAIVAGTGSISQSGTTLTVNQSSASLIANWQSFDIAAGNTVVFHQPGSTAVALNRVTGADASAIYGSLIANGQVFLVNPNGVLFAPGAQVSVGGLVASTLSISDADFASGHYRFTEGSVGAGSIVNQGSINAGSAVLIAPEITNSGTISTPGGQATLAAGQQVTVNLLPGGLLTAQVDVSAPNAQIQNHGRIAADGGAVSLLAGRSDTVADSLINTDGVIEAHSIRNVNGTVYLDGGAGGTVTVSGTIDASGPGSGAHGGNITALGKHVGLMAGAQVNASGDAGGGTVLIGGNQHGQGPEMNAEATYMDPAAVIHADATTAGSGGQVVLWSNSYTGFYGAISAHGGSNGGNGGQVETSSHDNLQAFGTVDASASKGAAGQWLMDPADVTIVIGSTNTNDTDSGGVFTPSAGSAQIGATNISNDLNAGTNVAVTTTGGSGGNGDITVSSAITKTANVNATLTLDADRNIMVNAGINDNSATGKLNVILDAHYSSDTAVGNVTFNGNGAFSLTTNGGNVVIGGGSNPAVTPAIGLSGTSLGRGVYVYSTTIDAGGGNITINGQGGANLASGELSRGVEINGSTVKTSGTGTISFTGWGSSGGSASDSYGVNIASSAGNSSISTASGALTITGTGGTVGTSASAMAGVTFRGGKTDAIFSTTGAITFQGTALNLGAPAITGTSGTTAFLGWNGGSTVSSGNLTFIGTTPGGSTAGAGGITLPGVSINGNGGSLTINSSTSLSGLTLGSGVIATGATWSGVTIGDANTGAIVDGGNVFTVSGATSVTGSSYTLSGANTFTSNTFAFGNANAIANSGALTFGETSATTVANSISGTGNLIQAGAGTLSLTGANSYSGTTTVNTGDVLQIGGAGSLGSGGYSSNIVDNGVLEYSSSAPQTFSGVISGSGDVTKDASSSTLMLTNSNTYGGTTTISAGTLAVTNASGLGSTSGGTVVNGGGSLDLQNVALGAESITLAGGSGAGTYGTLTTSTGNSSLSGPITLAGPSYGWFNVAGGAQLTVSGVISGSGGVYTSNAGTLVFSGTNTYSGGTLLSLGSSGTLATTNDSGLGTGIVNLRASTTLDLRNVTISVPISGNGGTLLASTGVDTVSGTVTSFSNVPVDVLDGVQLTITSNMSTPTTLVKNGNGVLALTGNNTRTGATTINAGTVQVGNGGTTGTLGGGAVTVASGANLIFDRSDTVSLSTLASNAAGISGQGNLSVLIGGGFTADRPINLSGTNSNILLEAGKNVAAGDASGGDVTLSSAITTSATGTVTIFSGNANTAALDAAVSGASGAIRYKTYGASVASTSGAVGGTRNYYYRQAPSALTVTGLTATKVYDGLIDATSALDTSGAAVAGLLDGDVLSVGSLTLTGAAFDSAHAGTRTVNATFSGPTPTYSGGGATWSVSGYSTANLAGSAGGTITARPVMTTVDAVGKTYDGTSGTTSTLSAPSGFVGSDGATGVSGIQLAFADPHAGVESVVASGTGSLVGFTGVASGNGSGVGAGNQVAGLASDYTVMSPSAASATITPAPVTVAIDAVGRTYDGLTDTSSTLGAPVGFIGNDSATGVSGIQLAFDNPHAGVHNVVASGTGSLVGFTGAAQGNGSGVGAGNAVAGLASDYTVVSPSAASATITPAPVTVAISAVGRTYDGLTDTSSTLGAPVGFIGNDSATGVSGIQLAFDNPHAGVHNVVASGTGSLVGFAGAAQGNGSGVGVGNAVAGLASDYTVVSPGAASATITPAPVTVAINGVGKTYDGLTDTASTLGTPSGFIGNDSATAVSGLSLAFDDPNAGTRNVLASGTGGLIGFSGGARGNGSGVGAGNEVAGLASDYSVVTPSAASAVIGEASLTVTANDDAKIVTQSDTAGYEGVSYSGFVHGENPSVLAGSLSIARSNAGTESAGSYAGVLVPSGLSSSNYAITYVNGNYQILPAQQLLVKIGNVTSAYGTSPGYTITSAEYLDGNGSGIHTLTQTAQSGNTYTYSDGLGGSVTFTVSPQGAVTSGAGYLAVGNYMLSGIKIQVSGSDFLGLTFVGNQSVTPIALTPDLSGGVSKVYDGTDAMTGLTVTLTGQLTGDQLQVNGNGAFDSKNAGSGLGYVVNGLTLGSADAGNYYLAATAFSGNNGVITPKPISVSGITADDKVYDGTAAATLTTSGAGLAGVASGDTVELDVLGYSASFANRNAGTGKAVTVAGLTLEGADAGDYTLIEPTGLTASITPRPLVITAVSNTKGYDGTTAAAANPLVSGSLAAGDSFTALGEVYASKGVGSGLTLIPLASINDGNGGQNYTMTFVDNDQGVIEPPNSWIPGDGSSSGGIGAQAAGSLSDSAAVGEHGGSVAWLAGSRGDQDAAGDMDGSGADSAALSVQCERRIERKGLLQVSDAGMRLPAGLAPRALDVCRAGSRK